MEEERENKSSDGAGPRLAIADIEFPRAGSFSYRLEGIETVKTIQIDTL